MATKIQLVRIAHVFYTHEHIDRARDFLADFGMQETKRVGDNFYFRGTGSEPFVYCARKGQKDEFGGAAFVVESEADLEVARSLPGATDIYQLSEAPGGGKCVTFYDPVDRFPMHLVHGQILRDHVETRTPLDFNFPEEKHRPGNKTQRFEKGPAPVHKLGHFGMCVTDFAKAYQFYTTHFNFKASNLVYDGTGRDITTFLHLDRGSELVDHHCFFFFEGPQSHVHHSSFETHDFDTQILGHDWLRHRGYQNCWGVGRHIMGSQIFDYWFDTSGFIVEHYVDGDLVNEANPIERELAQPGNLHVWGPDLPSTFMQ
ncbi:Glyoxalase/Bleomycin resistance protein/Dihydroxybiphenyl dioxygenase [Aspergillus pseudodeflectus]|uniref:Glyoxalase/Bleomycin resistance protein/Dihydroxybiphenyl dioxygenase n=1 Tax=Aspergillus pseudodeflectus TaxID=176178 RepID=A0ABR4KSM1_9EURO